MRMLSALAVIALVVAGGLLLRDVGPGEAPVVIAQSARPASMPMLYFGMMLDTAPMGLDIHYCEIEVLRRRAF